MNNKRNGGFVMAKKRGNGEGSISYHKASNRYIAQYTKPNGKRGAIYGKTPTEARNKLKNILSEIQMHTYTEKKQYNFNSTSNINC